MGRFTFTRCLDIEGLYMVEPRVFGDERGYNLEVYNEKWNTVKLRRMITVSF